MSLKFRKPGTKEGKPQNEAQRLASSENFAIFTLKGMRDNTVHLQGVVPPATLYFIHANIDTAIKEIKTAQELRKEIKDGKA